MGGPPPVRLIEVPHWAVLTPRRARAVAGFDDTPPAGPAPGTDANPLSLERAAELFADMRAQRHIPFDFPQSYCSARAHEMRRLMALQGVECRKVFFLATVGHSIRAEHPAHGTITWSYHVAPTVAVRTPQGVVTMVIDPSLFDGPVTIEQWRAVMECDSAQLQETQGAIYQPFDARDDEYRQTQRLLEEARLEAEGRGLASERAARTAEEAAPPPFIPPPPAVDDALADGIVPDEDSADDDDDLGRTA
jgi:hypothetical protein